MAAIIYPRATTSPKSRLLSVQYQTIDNHFIGNEALIEIMMGGRGGFFFFFF